PRPFDGELYAQVDGPILTVPMMAPIPDIRFVLWLQVLHQKPITGGLGEHLPGHLPSAWEQFVDNNRLLDVLRDANTERLTQRVVTPADIELLREAGLRWVVIDSAVLTRERPAAWMQRHRSILSSIWGAPDVSTDQGFAWRLDPIPETVRIPDQPLPPVRPPSDGFATPQPRPSQQR
ncbi:MAG TPA: hypothetical protein DFR83_28415, partial [Deltaproteobacteria bacterium]|nr:hypothetical protein [Deltaproteobacteria bacterium]